MPANRFRVPGRVSEPFDGLCYATFHPKDESLCGTIKDIDKKLNFLGGNLVHALVGTQCVY